jgi:hypothetical protein
MAEGAKITIEKLWSSGPKGMTTIHVRAQAERARNLWFLSSRDKGRTWIQETPMELRSGAWEGSALISCEKSSGSEEIHKIALVEPVGKDVAEFQERFTRQHAAVKPRRQPEQGEFALLRIIGETNRLT